jgi:sugar phosphate isomerase/epimerase
MSAAPLTSPVKCYGGIGRLAAGLGRAFDRDDIYERMSAAEKREVSMVGIVLETLKGTPWECSADDLERIAHGAYEGGFREVSVLGGHAAKMGVKKARKILDDAGLTATMGEWHPYWERGSAAVLENVEQGLDVLDELGAKLMLACMNATAMDFPVAVEGFATLCERAARRGVKVALEFIPPWVPPDLSTAWDLVREAGAGNGGLTIDTMHWHYQKGGPNFELLRSIPGEKFFYVQICDAEYPQMPADKDYITVATTARLAPGDGLVDIPAVLKTLSDLGAEPFYAMEVYNAELSAQGAGVMAKKLHEIGEALFA